jgi:Ca-activated chloride channel homolog
MLKNKKSVLRITLAILSFLLLVLQGTFGQKENKLLRAGNSDFESGKFNEAEKKYRKALELNKESYKGKFNLGTAVYKEKNFEESSKIYSELAGNKLDPKARSNVFYNLGNSLLEAKKYDESILAYQKSLINNPLDKDAKYNLEFAKMMLKKQQQEQQKNQQNKDQQKKDQDKKDKQDQQQDQQDKNSQSKNQQDHRKISKEDADRMLEAMKNDEKKTMQKVQKQKVKAAQVIIEKDW